MAKPANTPFFCSAAAKSIICLFNVQQLKKLLENLANTVKEEKQALIDLDSVMGDGDLGLTMEKVFLWCKPKK